MRRASGHARRRVWQVGVALEIVGVYGQVIVALHRGDIRAVTNSLREPRVGLSGDERVDAVALARAVIRVLSYAPTRSRCLVQSLVLTRMLARRGIHSSLVIGVTPSGDFAAHAWVELGDTPLLPPLPSKYAPLVRI